MTSQPPRSAAATPAGGNRGLIQGTGKAPKRIVAPAAPSLPKPSDSKTVDAAVRHDPRCVGLTRHACDILLGVWRAMLAKSKGYV